MPQPPFIEWTERIARSLRKGDGPDPSARAVEYEGLPAVEVSSYQGLVRVLGYMKYSLKDKWILFRGQTRCYGSLQPGIYRAAGEDSAEVDALMDGFLDRYRDAMGFDPRPAHKVTTEPLLQHYGIRTRWVDLVDSIPYALFFATRTLRQIAGADDVFAYIDAPGEKGVIYLVDCGYEQELRPVSVVERGQPQDVPGIWAEFEGRQATGFQVCDLRRAKPSKALRPHAQHGWLCRPEVGEQDLWYRVVLRIVVPTGAARVWLGSGDCTSPGALFPSPADDFNFHRLLDASNQAFLRSQDDRLGRIMRFAFHDNSGS
jgi:hypothetical protein